MVVFRILSNQSNSRFSSKFILTFKAIVMTPAFYSAIFAAITGFLTAGPLVHALPRPQEFNSVSGNNSFSLVSERPYDTPDGYNVLFLQEFNEGETLDESLWTFDEGFLNKNTELQIYTRDNVRIENGHLVFTANYTDGQLYSSSIHTRDKFDYTYGRFEVRLKTSLAAGMFPAAWSLGYGTWPTCGEMDLFEYIKAWDTEQGQSQTKYTLHYDEHNGINGTGYTYLNNPSEYHVYGLEWEESAIKFYLDGNQMFQVDRPTTNLSDYNWPYHAPQYLVLNLALAPDWGPNGRPEDLSTLHGQQYAVDWIRIMQKSNTSTGIY